MAFTDIDLAILSQVSYQINESFEGKSLYDVLTDSNMNSYLNESLGSGYTSHIKTLIERVKESSYTVVKVQDNTSSGFAAFAVKDPDNNVTVACRGTELGKILTDPGATALDIAEDVKLALSNETAQQADMSKFMSELQKDNYNSYTFTGHSLGGNLAMYGAITLDDPSKLARCTTFNAPGFNKDFRSKYKDNIAAIKKRNICYQNKYDGVSEALTVPGTVVILASKKKSHDGGTGHMLNDLVTKDGEFKIAKNKSITLLGSILYLKSRRLDNMVFLESVMPVMKNLAATDIKLNNNTMPFMASNVMGASGFGKIQVTPAELKQQAAQMVALSNEYDVLFDGVISELNSVNGNWSANLANNFSGKITSAQGKLKYIPEILSSGAAVANLAAINYESTDSMLTKVMSGDAFKQD